MTMTEPALSPEPSAAPRSRSAIIGALAGCLARDGFPRGDLAALRRLDAMAPEAPAFWRLLLGVMGEAGLPGDKVLRRWALICKGMALMAPHHFSAETTVGHALSAAGYHESRLARLLNARGAQFPPLVIRLCRQLGAKAQPLDWRSLGRLILLEGYDDEKAEDIRLAIARHYYAAEARKAR